MASFNKVILAGNLTRDVELRFLQNGTAVTDLGLAVNSRRKNQAGEWVEDTVFVDVTLWGRTAEVASEYLGKGSSVLIEGRLRLDSWEKDGHKHSKLRVVGETMQMLGAPRGGGSNGGSGGSARGRSEQRAGSEGRQSGGSVPGLPHYDESEGSRGSEPGRTAEAAIASDTNTEEDIPF